MRISPNKWLINYKNNPGASVNLVCFPFGGAAASAYRPLTPLLGDHVQLWSVQLPGRESRFAEPFADTADAVIRAVAEDIALLGLEQLAVFGHSMGSDLAIAYTKRARQGQARMPGKVIVSGNKPPHLNDHIRWSQADDRVLLDHVVKLGGLPREVADDPDFAEIYLDKIRADYRVYESAQLPQPAPVDAPLTVIYGNEDPLLTDIDMNAWQAYAGQRFRLREVRGGHFYFQNDFAGLAQILGESLA